MSWVWKNVNDQALLIPGKRYRIRWIINSPYPNETVQTFVRASIFAADTLNKSLAVRTVTFYQPDQLVYVSRYQPWELEVVYDKKAWDPLEAKGGPSMRWSVGLIAGAVSALFLGWSIVSRQGQELVEVVGETADKTLDGLSKTFFSPGAILAALVLGVLFLTRGKVSP